MAGERRPPEAGQGGGVESHPLVKALASDPTKPPKRSTKLFGYPGPSAQSGSTRLYMDLELTSYVDVPNAAILHSQTLPDDQGTVLWVEADATLTYSTAPQSHEVQAEFLSGSIAEGHLGAAASVGGGVAGAPPQLTATCPLTHVPICGPVTIVPGCAPTHVPPCNVTHTPPCIPTHLTPCPTQHVSVDTVCPTHQVSVCVVCPTHQVSVCVVCPTRQVSVCTICPTHQVTVCVVCPSHQVSVCTVCPTHQVTVCPICPSVAGTACPTHVCPSQAVPCQSVPACPTAICPQSIACGQSVGCGPGPGPITPAG